MSLRDEAAGGESVTGDQARAACQALCVHGLMSPCILFPRLVSCVPIYRWCQIEPLSPLFGVRVLTWGRSLRRRQVFWDMVNETDVRRAVSKSLQRTNVFSVFSS